MSKDIKVPYILTCRVTGLQKAYTSKDFVARKIENYGGNEQAMIDGYVSKDAKRLIKPFGENITEADVQSVITTLHGNTNAKDVLDLIKSGKLFLTKKVKVHVKGAAASKKNRTTKKVVKKKTVKKTTKKKDAPSVSVVATEAPATEAPATEIPETVPMPPANA